MGHDSHGVFISLVRATDDGHSCASMTIDGGTGGARSSGSGVDCASGGSASDRTACNAQEPQQDSASVCILSLVPGLVETRVLRLQQ